MRLSYLLVAGAVGGALWASPALAQDDDDPWGRSADDSSDESSDDTAEDASDDTAEDASDDTPDAVPEADPFAPPGADDPFAPPGVDDPAPDGESPEGEDAQTADGETEPVPPVTRKVPVTSAGNVPAGVRINNYGAGTGADVGQAFVLGSNGGTNQTMLRARYAFGKDQRMGLQVGLPFVAHRLPRGLPRDTGLGNLQLDFWYALRQSEGGWTGLGVEAHANIAPGARSYTWVHDADDTWPGSGLDLVLQSRRTKGKVTRMGRAALGVRGGRDYAPWAGSYVTFEVAGGLDYAINDRVGVVGEASFAYWDLSPFDVSGLVRADVSDGLRLRAGMVVPLAVWVGATGVEEQFRGVREVTALMDLSLSL